MKRFLLVVVMVTLLLVCASPGEAWQVIIKNSCRGDARIWVTGEHLFSRTVDCEVDVKSGTTKACPLPGAICPFDIGGKHMRVYMMHYEWHDLPSIHCSSNEGICCCWDVNVEVVQKDQDSCQLVRR